MGNERFDPKHDENINTNEWSENEPLLADNLATDVDQRVAVVIMWPYNQSIADVVSEIDNLITDIANKHLGEDAPEHTSVSVYQIGPAAAGFFLNFLCTVYHDVRPFINDGASLIAWGALAAEIVRRLRARFNNVVNELPYETIQAINVTAETFHPLLSEPMILGLCFKHFAEAYSETALSISSFDRSRFRSYSSAGHPGGDEVYTVRIWTKSRTSYLYVVDPRGKPIEHFMTRGRSMWPLVLPAWFDDDEGDFDSGCSELRTIELKN